MKNFAVVDETFDINQCASYHLAIELHNNGLCFAIMDTVRKKYIALNSHAFDENLQLSSEDQFKRVLSRDNYLNRSYKTSGLIYASPNAVVIPSPLFDPEKLEAIFKFSNLLPEDYTLISNSIPGIDSRIVFSVPKKLVDIIDDHSTDIRILHQSTPDIENSSINARRYSQQEYITLRIYPDFFDIIVFRNGEFELYNSFTYKTEEDMIFYILYVFEQLEINKSKAKLVLSGLIEEDNSLTDSLSQYIPDINFDKFNRNFSYSYTLGQLKEHRYSNLINLYLCV